MPYYYIYCNLNLIIIDVLGHHVGNHLIFKKFSERENYEIILSLNKNAVE